MYDSHGCMTAQSNISLIVRDEVVFQKLTTQCSLVINWAILIYL